MLSFTSLHGKLLRRLWLAAKTSGRTSRIFSLKTSILVCCRIDDAEVEVVWSKPVDKQTYNTRKALTKVFTNAGSNMMSDMVRRRGAAGIRGLGAPGTTPPKQLVARYASPSNSAAAPPSAVLQSPLQARHLTYKTAVEQLQDIAVANGWGEPVYSPVLSEQSEDGQERFCYMVILTS